MPLPHFHSRGSGSPHRTSHGALCPSPLPPHPLSPRKGHQAVWPRHSDCPPSQSLPLPFFHGWTQPVFHFIERSSSSRPRAGCVNTGSTLHRTETLASYLTTLRLLTTVCCNHWTAAIEHVTGFFLPCRSRWVPDNTHDLTHPLKLRFHHRNR